MSQLSEINLEPGTSTLDALNQLAEKADEKKEGVVEEESIPLVVDDEVKEEDEIKLEEEPKEEEIKLDESEDNEFDGVINKINRQRLLKDYPDLEKKYPQLLRAYYGNQEYRKLFPTLNDVKEAHARLEAFDKIESEVTQGSFSSLLKGLQEKNPDNFAKAVDGWMDNLRTVNEEAYYSVLGNNLKGAIVAMGNFAQKNKNEDLLTAAQMINSFFFPNEEKFVTSISFKKETKNPEVDALNAERNKFNQEKLGTHQSDINDKIHSVIENTITKHIDPKELMTPYVRKTAIKEAIETTKKLIEQDKEFQQLVDTNWKKAEKENFSSAIKDKIKGAYLSKAQTILPQVLKKIQREALQGVKGSKDETVDRKGPMERRGTATSSNKSSSVKLDPKEMQGKSTLELLNLMAEKRGS